MKIFDEALSRRLIYIFEADDDRHRGLLKIGETTVKKFSPTEEDLKVAARKRIKEFAGTMGVKPEPIYVTLAVRDDGTNFRDTDVHRLLEKFRHKFKGSNAREWFNVKLSTAVNAIKDVKRRKKLSAADVDLDAEKIIFRPEQEEAIARTVKHFKDARGKAADFLWNAKMRFGKTFCALEVIKEMNFDKTIIITHRPVVDDSWHDGFLKIFHGTDYHYFGRDDDFDFGDAKKFICFLSIQDLRGSKVVDGKFDKNEKIFATEWDFVIVDEAHEGTTTELGDKVIKNILKPNSKLLELSGTPFNILDDFAPETVYTWDYVMEQRAKNSWHETHPDEPNPYLDLPAMKIYTYDLAALFNYREDDVFSFKEFFRSTDGKNFVHAADVRKFLDMLTSAENYPFSRDDFRKNFRHSLWIIPGVKEGKALSRLLKRHKIFGAFKVVNVAGNGDSDDEPDDALKQVRRAIDNHEYTITLSCGKLTAGVTVPEWTAVFMLAGSVNTSAANYLQTIFRVQSPCTRGGFVKENCFVFDFAPDRTLKMIATSAAVSARAGRTDDADRKHLDALLNFCPVISLSGSRMNYRADDLLQQLKAVYVERAVRNGFEDNCLYNDSLLNLSQLELEKFANLKKIVSSSAAQKKSVVVNDTGLTGTQQREKSKTPRTAEQKELDKRKRQRVEAIKVLRAISVRLPLLIYGDDFIIDKNFSLDVFKSIDDDSWNEFMPAGVSKEIFSDLTRYYDRDVFIAAAKKIRRLAQDADALPPTERVQKIAELFATFRNPDKETVLTPWRVVQLHLDAAFDEKFFAPDKKILEINSKTGLYPLAVAEKIYRVRLGNGDEKKILRAALQRWDKTVAENIFVLCKTPMAVKITRRTLVGFRDQSHVNARHFPDLIQTLKTARALFLEQIVDKNFWSKGVGKMKFDAVVGNPPYQIAGSGDNKNFASPVYNLFMQTSFKLADKVSLIHPARCLFNAGATPQDFRNEILSDPHFKVKRYFPDSKTFVDDKGETQPLFPTSDIKGGVAITLRDATKNFGAIGTFIPFDELISIHQKVVLDNKNFRPLSEIIFSRTIYRLTDKMHEDFPVASSRQSQGHPYDMSTNILVLLPEIFFDDKPNDGHEYIQILGLTKMQRVYKWIRRDYVNAPTPLEKFKVLVPHSNGSGALGEVLSTPLVGSPLVGHTETFISVGAFDTRAEAEACMAYIKSKFARALLGILKVTQHNPPATWSKVPLEDFTSAGDIDWRGSVDAQLYDKYKLTAAEIKFIEEHVREMT
ncbi:MAG: Eco57I restriction-modification methylase domain-containing protein [Selenomonadaceae bacterium]|nr:Eco57I restriction-modification methylase domain-containing protein [Selenomonadaceae bacterium]